MNWMDGYASDVKNRGMMPPRSPLKVVKLSDHGGQYVLILNCTCGYTRTTQPHAIAAKVGWEALLSYVVKRMRCGRCRKRACSVTVRREMKRDK